MNVRHSDLTKLDIASVYDLMSKSQAHWAHSHSVLPDLETVAEALSRPDTWVCCDDADIPVGVATIDTRLERFRASRLEKLSASVHFLCHPRYLRKFADWVLSEAMKTHRVLKAELYSNQKQAIRLVTSLGFKRVGIDSHAALVNNSPVSRILYEMKRHEYKQLLADRRRYVADQEQAAS